MPSESLLYVLDTFRRRGIYDYTAGLVEMGRISLDVQLKYISVPLYSFDLELDRFFTNSLLDSIQVTTRTLKPFTSRYLVSAVKRRKKVN